ncbi:uncharacterized protein BDFB_001436, partial [Asbolus verrucosus]
MTTIRLLGRDAQSVSYKFGVNFNRFIPGIKYILNVTVINEGNVLEEKQLTLNYVDEDVKKSIKKPMASLLLLGPETSYAYTTYFNWELSDESGNTTLLPSKGAELKIPPDTFQSLQTYIIKSDLVAEGDSIANAQQTVNILSKGLLLQFPFKSLTARTNQPIRLRPYIKDLNNIDGEIRLSWSCINTVNNEECEYQSDTSELEMDSGFESPGKYKISLEISKSEFAETASCIVEVMDDVPITEIEEIEFPTNPSAGIEIHATIYDLKTFCTLQWTSIDEDGYEFLDFDSIPGNIATVINVTTKEDLFLYELEEFSNGTVDKRHNLIIPPPSESWEGLKGDAKYLFRLIIKCPPPTDDNFQEVNETASVPSETELITLMTDVIVETNGPPQIQQLDVKPAEGDAFKTLFSFKTQKARDKPGDEPILYKFGYILDNRDMILWNLGDKLIDLRNKLSDESENYTQRKLLSYERVKRSNSLSLQDVRNYIEVSELIITSSTDSNKINLEKENLRKQLFNYMENLCLNIKNNKLQLELKTLILSVEKLNRNSLNNFIHIPFEGNSWQTIARIKIGGSLENFRQKCI